MLFINLTQCELVRSCLNIQIHLRYLVDNNGPCQPLTSRVALIMADCHHMLCIQPNTMHSQFPLPLDTNNNNKAYSVAKIKGNVIQRTTYGSATPAILG